MVDSYDVILAEFSTHIHGGCLYHYAWYPGIGRSWNQVVTLCGVPIEVDTYVKIMPQSHFDTKATFTRPGNAVCPTCRRIFIREIEVDRGYDDARVS